MLPSVLSLCWGSVRVRGLKECELIESAGVDCGELYQREDEERAVHCHFVEEQHGEGA